jgi:pimeloyl-ACP methyl ester carboxylesterase
MPQTRYDFGGSGPVIHIALANGFPPQTYHPLLDPLTDRYQVVSLPPRPLWTNSPSPNTMQTWADMADDLLEGLQAHNLTDVIGMGHSMGGVATMLAAIKEPDRFRGIVLLDPTVFPQRLLWLLKGMRSVGMEGRFPLVNKALQRRASFTDRDEAFNYWRGKRLFTDWSDEALWHYVDGLTTSDGNGGLKLAWSLAWEARYYATIYTASWREIPKLEGLLPVLLIRGTTSNTFFENAAKKFRRRVPSATYAEIEGGHLYPQSAPDATRTVIEDWLQTL